MIRVNNRKVVTKLSQKSLQANRVRNMVAVFAIALTTMMFMALFTIAGTIVHTFQEQTFRQVGSSGHGAFKDLTLEEKEILEKDPMIKECGGRLFLGMGSGENFRKVHAELSYMEPDYLKRSFCEPEHGKVPQEGTKEIACDTRILSCVGIKTPEIGEEVMLTYEIGGMEKTEITDTFVLSGWWEYDPAGMASMAVLPKSYVDEIVKQYPQEEEDHSNLTGVWDLEIVLDSSMHIETDFEQILQNNGYQSLDPTAENYVSVGINWGYAGAQLSASSDPEMVLGVAVMLVLIIFTGYLIIYNIFQISVSGDIRFYGLLKTIGTTGRQIRHMIRRQAILLSVIGIPIGLIAGSLAGTVLAPVILATLSVGRAYQVMSPWFFAMAAIFSLVTVLISCAKPGRIAAKVSPVEAVRYTDAVAGRKKQKKGRAGGKPLRMAQANLGRNKKKTILVVVSMMLSVVLLQMTYTFANGFDMDKYLRHWVVSDFILGDASYFQTSMNYSVSFPSVAEEDISGIAKGGEITESGRIYGHRGSISVYTSEEAFRKQQSMWLSKDEIDESVSSLEKDASGNVSANVNLYGMEDYPLSQLQVIDGDLADVYDPQKRAIAAVYMVDDYGEPLENSQFAKVGDTVTMHYVYEWEYFDDETGKIITEEEAYQTDHQISVQEKKAADIDYEVAACVTIKNAMSYRYFGSFSYVLNAQVFQKDSQTSNVMTYLFNTTPESNDTMERYLEDYTNEDNPNLNFESKQRYVEQFEEFRNMFLLMGSALSFVVGLVGILNFFNAVLTSIHSRKREFAMLQSIGMTGSQLKKMLIYEGLVYGAAAICVALVISLLLAPVAGDVIGNIFWFFTYHFTVLPILAVIPIFALLGVVLPLVCYRNVAKQTIVERLRESE